LQDSVTATFEGVLALVISGDRVVYHETFGKQDVGRGVLKEATLSR